MSALKNDGFIVVENSDCKFVFVRYLNDDDSLPKYKRPCEKIIFDKSACTIQVKGRNERGNVFCPSLSAGAYLEIFEMAKKIGMIKND